MYRANLWRRSPRTFTFISVLLSLCLVFTLTPTTVFADAAVPADELPQRDIHAAGDPAAIHTYSATPGDTASSRYTMKANGVSVFVTAYQKGSNNRVHVSRFASSEATPTIEITNNAPISSYKIYPERYYPASAVQISGNQLTFDMAPELRYALVEINGATPSLAIINDPPENPGDIPNPAAANVLNVMDYVTDNTGATDQTAQITAAINALYATAEKDTLYFPNGSYRYAGLELRNRTKPVTIYVAEGALLKNRIQPTMEAMEPAIGIWDSANITIRGRGIFDGNGYANYDTGNGGWRHDAVSSHHQGGAMIVRSQYVTFQDTYVRDAKQWNWETHTTKHVNLFNIKGLTPYSQPWIDGLDLASGQDTNLDGAITLGNDDCFATGHYNPDDGFNVAGNEDRLNWDTEDSFNVSVKNTLNWSVDAGNGVRMGHNTYGHQLKNYYFENFNAVGFGGNRLAITVQNNTGTYPNYESVIFKNCSWDTSKAGTNIQIRGQNTSNRIATVTLDGCWFSNSLPSNVQNATDLTVKNLYIAEQRVFTEAASRIALTNVTNYVNDFVENHPPVFASIPDVESFAGDPLSFLVSATDQDGDVVTLGVTGGTLPSGATFNSATGQFSWTPGESQIGRFNVQFTASDPYETTTKTVPITVKSSGNVEVDIYTNGDTNISSWSNTTDQIRNYGDNEYLRVFRMTNSNTNTALGQFGELYSGNGGTGNDGKIGFLKFNLSDYKEKVISAKLTLTVQARARTYSGNDTVKVTGIPATWVEGNGKSAALSGYRASTIAGSLTWQNKPAFDTRTALVKESNAFSVDGIASMTLDTGYAVNSAVNGTKVVVDVTDFISALAEEENNLGLAFCETQNFDLIFVSKEGAARNSNANATMQPTLTLTLRTADKKTLDQALKAAKDRIEEIGADKTDYTTGSWAALVAAVAIAEPLLADIDAVQEDVDKAVTALNAAVQGLTKHATAAEIDTLTAIVTAAEALNEEDYLAEGWAKLAAAITTARAILGAPADYPSAAATAAGNTIVQAREALVPVGATFVDLYATADTHVQTWNATEQSQNYGDNEYLRVFRMVNSNTNANLGLFGELYSGSGGTNNDGKVSFLRFNLADYKDKNVVSAKLTLTYHGRSRATYTGNDTIKVTNVPDGWVEGNGKSTQSTYRPSTIADSLRWTNRPAFDTRSNVVKESNEFRVDRLGNINLDGSYTVNTNVEGSKVTVDVTDFVNGPGAAGDNLNLAFCDTKNFDLAFVSREGAVRNNNANASMQPTLTLTILKDPVGSDLLTALQFVVDNFESTFPKADYTPGSWAPFEKALDDAKAILAKPTRYSDEDVYAVMDALMDTSDKLVRIADKSGLKMAIDYAENILKPANVGKYIPASVTNLEDVLSGAAIVYADADATQAKVDKANEDLLKAIGQVYEKGDKAGLQALVTLVSRYAPASYTPASWTAFAKALEDARAVIANPNVVKESVDKAYTALSAAITGLTRKADVAALNSSITLAQQIVDNIGDYVPSTVVGLAEELAAAKAVANNPDATQAQVNAATATLNTKVLAARLKPDLSGLLSATVRARALEESLYTAESYKVLTTAVAGAEAILSVPDKATQADVDDATVAVYGAIATLVAKPPVATAAGNDGKNVAKTVIPKVKISKVTASAKGKIVVKWAKAPAAAKVTGYQVQYRVKGASKWRTKTISAKSASLTIKNLKKNKQYQIRVRAYRTGSATEDYGAWSAVKVSKRIK